MRQNKVIDLNAKISFLTVPAELSPSTGEFRQLRRKKLGEEYSLYFENNTSVYTHWCIA